MSTPPIIPYHTPERTSRLALAAFALSLGSILLFFLIVPFAISFLFALFALSRVSGTMDTQGQRVALLAARISGYGFLITFIIYVLTPSLGGSGPSTRSYCAANLKGIVQSLNVYANDWSDAYPVVQYAPYSPGLNDARAMPASAKAEDTIRSYYNAPYHQAGSPQAILWQLVLRGDVSPKSFICRDDPWKTTAAEESSPTGEYFDNFQHGRQLSYSIAYPWKADGAVGKWWRGAIDPSIPIMADMAPQQGTGTPATDLTGKPLTKAANSANHLRDGQNVAFGDNHVEFVRLPDCGQADDNIYTASAIPSAGPLRYGGVPASRVSPQLTADTPPFDIVMMPVRNETTGRY